jgi:hypothetical protein
MIRDIMDRQDGDAAMVLRSEPVTSRQAVAIARWMGFGERNAYAEGDTFVWKGDPGMVGGVEPLRSDVDYGYLNPILEKGVELDFGSGQCAVVALADDTEFWPVFDAIVAASSI